MRSSWLVLAILQLVVVTAWAHEKTAEKPDEKDSFVPKIQRLIGQLGGDDSAQQDAAVKELLELAGASSPAMDRFLTALPKETKDMPAGMRERVERVRKQVESRAKKAATLPTTITLSAKDMPLSEVLAAMEKQTGNRLTDNREKNGEAGADVSMISIDLKNERFWPAVDQILDKAQLRVNSEGGDDALAIVNRDAQESPRHGRAMYEGPFRLDVTDVQAERSLRRPEQKSLKLQLEVAWEPRLRPIALSHPTADLWATTDTGRTLITSFPEVRMDVEVANGTQVAEMTLPFDLPERGAKSLTVLHGKLQVLVPSRIVKFRFDDVAKAAGKTQNAGGVQISIDDVRKNNAVWEVHMRFAFDEEGDALQLHRSWVFQNPSYLLDKNDQQVDNGGLETTRQTKTEVGVAYVFDVPTLDGMTWVYETPAAIVELPVEYEIKDIELP